MVLVQLWIPGAGCVTFIAGVAQTAREGLDASIVYCGSLTAGVGHSAPKGFQMYWLEVRHMEIS